MSLDFTMGIIASEFVSELLLFFKFKQTYTQYLDLYLVSVLFLRHMKASFHHKFEKEKSELQDINLFIFFSLCDGNKTKQCILRCKLQITRKKVAMNFFFSFFNFVAETGFHSDILQTVTYKMQITSSKKYLE